MYGGYRLQISDVTFHGSVSYTHLDVYKRQFVNKVREYHADGAFDDLAIDIEKAIDLSLIHI